MAPCVPCGRNFHCECRKGCRKCHPKEKKETTNSEPTAPTQRKKNNLRDAESTGRKRAARLYPINPDAACQWQGKKNCGGGKRPIVGCLSGLQKHRHHGPIKNTTRNEEGNVHLICTGCHGHWHELNDLVYDQKDYELLPHAPVVAEPIEIMTNLIDWKSGAMGKKYELASSKNKAMLGTELRQRE